MDVTKYNVTIRPLSEDEGGGYLAEILDLPGCMGDGQSLPEAIADVYEAARGWIEVAEKRGIDIPLPSELDQFSGKWVQRVPKSLHRELTYKAKTEGVSINTLVSTLIAKGLGREAA